MTGIHSETVADSFQQAFCTSAIIPSEQRQELWLSNALPGVIKAEPISDKKTCTHLPRR